mgnify:CR=1 FL=1
MDSPLRGRSHSERTCEREGRHLADCDTCSSSCFPLGKRWQCSVASKKFKRPESARELDPESKKSANKAADVLLVRTGTGAGSGRQFGSL